MNKNRKAPITSAPEMARIAAGATKEILPPPHIPLQDCDLPYWNSVIAEFARADWSSHQLELAALLARTLCNLEEWTRDLREQGPTSFSVKGTPVINPMLTVVAQSTQAVMNFRRTLSLNAQARGNVRERATMQAQAKEIEAGATSPDPLENMGDDLLARPN